MIGKLYSSEEKVIEVFNAKNLFNTTITLNEDSPTEQDMENAMELYKLLMMANYYGWEVFGKLQLKPLKINPISRLFQGGGYLSFRITKTIDYSGNRLWTVETNAPSLQLQTIIDNWLWNKFILMQNRYKNTHSSQDFDKLTFNIAGIGNRHEYLSSSKLSGEWIATYKEKDHWPIITTMDSIRNQLLTPAYTIEFMENSRFALGGGMYDAIQIRGTYDSAHNIIISDSNIIIAYVVAIEDDQLKVVFRCRKDENGRIIDCGDNLEVMEYRRVSDLKRTLNSW